MSEEQIERETVSIGLDFRPIPVNLGDNKLWYFNPDPDPDAWDGLVGVMKQFASLAGLKEDDLSALKDVEIGAMLTELSDAIAAMLVDEEQRMEWKGRRYGLMAQQKVAAALMKEISGFPTKLDSGSGENSEPTGPTA